MPKVIEGPSPCFALAGVFWQCGCLRYRDMGGERNRNRPVVGSPTGLHEFRCSIVQVLEMCMLYVVLSAK